MRLSKKTFRIILRYAVLQIPGLALLALILLAARSWLDLPFWFLGVAIAAWLIKDALMFPFVRRAYDWDGPGELSMIGKCGLAKQRLDPSGYVHVRGELWKARTAGDQRPIEMGQTVRVREERGLTLIVEADPAETGDLNADET